ncbi:MAG TPA: tetratricopeptide repeat protein, partial [Candidatus Angelobacter sp.]|nr:tetratricopeptide repeat protein [Candidatus Angelobacter sp.]
KTLLFQTITLTVTAALLVAGVVELAKTKGSPISPLERALTKGDYPAVINILEPAVAADPEDADILAALGEAYARNHEPGKAITTLEKALKLAPNSPLIYALMGEAYTESQEQDKAIASYEQALKLNPNMPEVAKALQNLRTGNPAKK